MSAQANHRVLGYSDLYFVLRLHCVGAGSGGQALSPLIAYGEFSRATLSHRVRAGARQQC
jgi:hypothetical protein